MDKIVTVTIYISRKLLRDIEGKVEGNSRNEKIIKCVKLGYKVLMGE